MSTDLEHGTDDNRGGDVSEEMHREHRQCHRQGPRRRRHTPQQHTVDWRGSRKREQLRRSGAGTELTGFGGRGSGCQGSVDGVRGVKLEGFEACGVGG
jgi:hypothetical protein